MPEVFRDAWRVDLLNAQDRLKRSAVTAAAGSLSWSVFKAVAGSGTLQLDDPDKLGEIDWFRDRFRITYLGEDGEKPMGVWIPSVTSREVSTTRTSSAIALSDKTESLNSPIGEWVSYPPGLNVVETVKSIIQERGEVVTTVTDSPETLLVSQTWDPSEDYTWLGVVNELLGMINYKPLRADLAGHLRIEPLIPDEQRPIRATYGPRQETDLLMTPEWSDEADLHSLPTGVRIIVEGNDEQPGFIGRADLPDEHPLSAAVRGRPELRTYNEEATSQVVADEKAAASLAASLRIMRSVSIDHPVDHTDLDDVILHRPTGLTANIVNREVTLGVGPVVKDRVRYFYRQGEYPWPLRA